MQGQSLKGNSKDSRVIISCLFVWRLQDLYENDKGHKEYLFLTSQPPPIPNTFCRENAASVNRIWNSFVSSVFALCSTSDRNIWFEAKRYYFKLSIIFQLFLGKACYPSPPMTLTYSSIHLYFAACFQISDAAARICLLLPAGGKLCSA